MRSKLRWALLGLAVAGLAANTMNAASDPCWGQFVGARLLGSLLELSMTADALSLLNGREDPKLKRLLEWRLTSAAADARRDVDDGPVLEGSPALPNLAHGVQKATAYVVAHHLDRNPPVAAGEKSVHKPLENLRVVRRWLSKQRQ